MDTHEQPPTLLEVATIAHLGVAQPGITLDAARRTAQRLAAAGAVELVGGQLRHVPNKMFLLERIAPALAASVRVELAAKLADVETMPARTDEEKVRRADAKVAAVLATYGDSLSEPDPTAGDFRSFGI